MKVKAHRLGTVLEVLGNCLCLLSAACSICITFASILGIVEKAANNLFWRLTFLLMYLATILCSLICAGEYIILKLAHSSTLLNVFENKVLSNIKKAERVLQHTGIVCLNLIFVFNLLFARIIWNGDGHGLAGTWLYSAGSTPIIISFIAMIPVCIQNAAWKVLLKKQVCGAMAHMNRKCSRVSCGIQFIRQSFLGALAG